MYADTGGPILVKGLQDMGFDVDGPVVVPDGDPVGGGLARRGRAAAYDVIVTTGGTGLSPTDRTPEQTRPLLDFEVPGIAEALRGYGAAQGIPTAVFSRGLVGRRRPDDHRQPAGVERRLPRRAGRARPAAGPRGRPGPRR